MRHFLTFSGPPIDLGGLEPLSLLPVCEAQDYIQKLESELSALDGAPVFLVHDGHSGTSDGIVSDTVSALGDGEEISGTVFHALMKRLLKPEHTIRLWCARNDPAAHLRVTSCESFEDAMREFQEQSQRTGTVNMRVLCACY